MTTYIIGIGLIGGSLAIALRERVISSLILASDSSKENEAKALELALADRMVTLDEGLEQADLIVLATPVSIAPSLAVKILNKIKPHQILIDVGSIKGEICEMVSMHANRGRFVATHPMWGTEHSGPTAAVSGAFASKSVVICDGDLSDADALEKIEDLYKQLNMNLIEMNSEEHDLHAAYISHISHITSFALALTVLEKEREEQHIFDMASTGFESTVRLAKSSQSTWIPVLLRNKYNVLDVLREHIHQLQVMRKAIEQDDEEQLREMITKANSIERIISRL